MTVAHPFAKEDITAGQEISADMVTMIPVPIGTLSPVVLPVVARRALSGGDPVLASDTGVEPAVPAGWMSLALPIAGQPPPGTTLELIVTADSQGQLLRIPAVVSQVETPSGFDQPLTLVAVPPDAAGEVALAQTEGRIVVFIDG